MSPNSPTPADPPELTSMILWPTIGSNPLGRLAGRMCSIGSGSGRFLTLGKLLALPAIPLALAGFAWVFTPVVCRRYRLTNRRIVIHKGYSAKEAAAVELDGFDEIAIERLPGQAWLQSGEVIFRQQGREVFRLSGVSRPEVFQHTCRKAQTAMVAVRDVLEQQSQVAASASA